MIVVGIGNALRGDDAAGLAVARRLADADVPAVAFEGEPVGLLELWAGSDVAIVVDAVRTGAPAGTLHRWDVSTAPLPAALDALASTHAVGLAETLELARALGRLPRRVVVLGVEGERFDTGAPLSDAVAAALGPAADAARAEARRLAAQPASDSAAPPGRPTRTQRA